MTPIKRLDLRTEITIPVYVMGDCDLWHSFVVDVASFENEETGQKGGALCGAGFGGSRHYAELDGGPRIFVKTSDLIDALLEHEDELRELAKTKPEDDEREAEVAQ